MKRPQDTISVLLPVYVKDSPVYFRLAIESILQQTYDLVHIYVGVDGPVEASLNEVLCQYESGPKISIIRFEKNRGLAKVLNDLLAECIAEGAEYIARMDADDISLPDRFEKQLAFLREHPEIDVVGGAIEEIDENGNSRNKIIEYPLTPETCREFFQKRNPMAHPTVMFRRRFFDKIGRFYETNVMFNEDVWLWHDGLKHNAQLANLLDVVLLFRVTGSLYQRRGGYQLARKKLVDRLKINKSLGYGFMANMAAYAMFMIAIVPAWVRKIAYRVLR